MLSPQKIIELLVFTTKLKKRGLVITKTCDTISYKHTVKYSILMLWFYVMDNMICFWLLISNVVSHLHLFASVFNPCMCKSWQDSFSINMPSYQCRNCHCKDKAGSWLSDLFNVYFIPGEIYKIYIETGSHKIDSSWVIILMLLWLDWCHYKVLIDAFMMWLCKCPSG